jgi:predicted aldo/keto reductase-like oxidoreductase
MSNIKSMNRRRFLRNSALGVGALGAGMIHSQEKAQEKTNPDTKTGSESQEPLKIKEYRTLGRTGFKVSDISAGFVSNPAVLEQLLDAGVNYIDSAESYGNEAVIGSVIKNRDRKKVFITTKLQVAKGMTKEDIINRSNKCLERLQTDYIDCMMMHSPETVEALKFEPYHEAMTQLKQEGKIHFTGVSNHGTNWYVVPKVSMKEVLTAAAMDGRFDVMLLAYNFVQDDKGADVLELCSKKNIGTTLMKVNPIANLPVYKKRIEEMKQKGKKVPDDWYATVARLEAKEQKAQEFIKKYNLDNAQKMRDAAIRFCLSNPNVNAVCCSFGNFDHLGMYLPLSGTRLSDMEKEKLAAYKEGCAPLYCRHACGICEPSCPHHVPINTIMRYNHYFDAQGKEKFAMKKYARLNVKADLCENCKGFCESACPHDVPIHALLNMAHHNLSINV